MSEKRRVFLDVLNPEKKVLYTAEFAPGSKEVPLTNDAAWACARFVDLVDEETP